MNPYLAAGGSPPQYQQYPYASNPPAQMQNPTQYYQQQYPQSQPYGTAMQQPQQPPQGNTQSCYNCGDSSHWAQDCPEPRRANPAGANRPNPAKRVKPNGPIITRYPPPPSPAFGQNPPPQAFGQNQPPPRKFSNGLGYGYPQQLGQYAPPTPNSASYPNSANSSYGQPQYQWPQQQSPQQYNPQYQQAPSYGPQGLPTPSTAYGGSQFSSPASGHPSAQQQGFFPPQRGSFSNTFRRPSDMSSRQNSIVSEPGSIVHQPHSAAPSVGPSRQQTYISEPSRQHSYSSENFSTEAVSAEPWMEELEGLDIPDNTNGGSHINGRQLIWKPANPVAMPLPSNFYDAERLGFLPIAATLKEGQSVSKYFQSPQEDSYFLNVRASTYWVDMEGEPAFLEVATECACAPFEDLIQQRNVLWGLERNMDLESEDEEGELQENDDYQPSDDYFQAQPDSLTNGTVHDDLPIEQADNQTVQPVVEDEETRAAREQEEKLAALGVSGIPKPVHAPARPVNGSGPTSADDEPQQGTKRSRSRSPVASSSFIEALEVFERSKQPLNGPHDLEKETSAHHSNPDPRAGQGNDNQSAPSDKRKSFDGAENKPPPPPPISGLSKRPSHLDQVQDPDTPEARPWHQPTNSVEQADSTSGNRAYQHTGQHESPPRRYSDRPNPRKRSFKRESSEESNEGPRRQEDDVTSKVKRRQPQVAAAYSRRW